MIILPFTCWKTVLESHSSNDNQTVWSTKEDAFTMEENNVSDVEERETFGKTNVDIRQTQKYRLYANRSSTKLKGSCSYRHCDILFTF